MKVSQLNFVLMAMASLVLIACGGGGAENYDDNAPIPDEPTPNANLTIVDTLPDIELDFIRVNGADLNDGDPLFEGQTLTIKITAIDADDEKKSPPGEIIVSEKEYAWTQRLGSTVDLPVRTEDQITFTVPKISSNELRENLVMRITVYDDEKQKSERDFTFVVEDTDYFDDIDVADRFLENCISAATLANQLQSHRDLTSLDCSTNASKFCNQSADCGIASLSGIEVLTNLQTLNLSNNKISDADLFFLDELDLVSDLQLSNNDIEITTPLGQMNGLTQVDLTHNPIEQVAGIADGVLVLASPYIFGLPEFINVSEQTIEQLTYQIFDPLGNGGEITGSWSDDDGVGVTFNQAVVAATESVQLMEFVAPVVENNSNISLTLSATANGQTSEQTVLVSVLDVPLSDLNIENSALKSCVLQEAIAQNWVNPLDITYIDCHDPAIDRLTGITNLDSVTDVDVSGSSIAGVAPLTEIINTDGERGLIKLNVDNTHFDVDTEFARTRLLVNLEEFSLVGVPLENTLPADLVSDGYRELETLRISIADSIDWSELFAVVQIPDLRNLEVNAIDVFANNYLSLGDLSFLQRINIIGEIPGLDQDDFVAELETLVADQVLCVYLDVPNNVIDQNDIDNNAALAGKVFLSPANACF